MQGNRRRDTSPELRLRSRLHALGLRYRVDHPVRPDEGLPVRPDICFTRFRVAIFVDGCFWHGCPEHGRLPAGNRGYWEAKLTRNRARDARDTRRLEAAGWRVLRVWEHVDAGDAAAAVLAEIDSARHRAGADPGSV
jgi:DNA mismatch endonuclease (patch repair protein)